MNPVKIFCFALIIGSALGGGQRYSRGAVSVLSAPVYQKTIAQAPLVYSKSLSVPAAVSYAPAAVQYAAPAAVQYAAPAAVQYAAPAVQYASAPAAVQYAHAPAVSYGAPATIAYSSPAIPAAPVALLSQAGKPSVYGKSIPAAAIRNVETVMVTKTITPVVTKTTTHHTAAEPALSLGHVQGYSQSAVGHAKVAPVQFNTQYTSYANPIVGVNGPVIYSGGAVGVAPVAAAGAQPVVAKAAVLKAPAAVAAVPAVAAAPAAYSVAAVPGAALSLDTYGYEAHSVPIGNFLEVKSGKAVLSGYYKK